VLRSRAEGLNLDLINSVCLPVCLSCSSAFNMLYKLDWNMRLHCCMCYGLIRMGYFSCSVVFFVISLDLNLQLHYHLGFEACAVLHKICHSA
jgi:hypothetical protein